MPSLLHQAQEVAELLEGAIKAQSRDYSVGEDITFYDHAELRTTKVSGNTPEQRIDCVMRAYAHEIVENIAIVQDGSDYFGDVDRSELIRSLEGTFSQDTKGARRYLLATASILFLMGATQETPARIPGFDFDLKGHPWIVIVLVFSVLAYQGVAFILHARADVARRSIAEAGVHEQLTGLRSSLSRISAALATLAKSRWPGDFAEYTKAWLAHTQKETAHLESEWSALQHRKSWELWLPAPLVLFAVVAYVARSLW